MGGLVDLDDLIDVGEVAGHRGLTTDEAAVAGIEFDKAEAREGVKRREERA